MAVDCTTALTHERIAGHDLCREHLPKTYGIDHRIKPTYFLVKTVLGDLPIVWSSLSEEPQRAIGKERASIGISLLGASKYLFERQGEAREGAKIVQLRDAVPRGFVHPILARVGSLPRPVEDETRVRMCPPGSFMLGLKVAQHLITITISTNFYSSYYHGAKM